MTSLSDIEACERCERPFRKKEIGGLPGARESMNVRCPHCGHAYTEPSDGFFQTTALSDEAEHRWLAERGQG